MILFFDSNIVNVLGRLMKTGPGFINLQTTEVVVLVVSIMEISPSCYDSIFILCRKGNKINKYKKHSCFDKIYCLAVFFCCFKRLHFWPKHVNIRL